MPLSDNERQVLLFNLHVAMIPEDASKVAEMTVPSVVAMLQEIYKAGKAVLLVGEYVDDPDDGDAEDGEGEKGTDGENVILIRDINVDEDGIATILLQHGDARAADPALMEIQDGSVRTAGKKATEVVAYAAHLVISTKHHVKAGQCRALLERVPNLGSYRRILVTIGVRRQRFELAI